MPISKCFLIRYSKYYIKPFWAKSTYENTVYCRSETLYSFQVTVQVPVSVKIRAKVSQLKSFQYLDRLFTPMTPPFIPKFEANLEVSIVTVPQMTTEGWFSKKYFSHVKRTKENFTFICIYCMVQFFPFFIALEINLFFTTNVLILFKFKCLLYW